MIQFFNRQEIKKRQESYGAQYWGSERGESRRRLIGIADWCYQVDVTEDDINKGVRCACKICPIALAMVRCLGIGHRSVWANGDMEGYRRSYQVNATGQFLELFSGTGARIKRWYTPLNAAIFIKQYDNEKDVGPFTFYLQVQGWQYPAGRVKWNSISKSNTVGS